MDDMITNEEERYTEANYTIGITSKKLGVSVHALRLYEAEGLIIPVKTETKRRLYSDLEIEKVRCIKNMIQNEGLNFAGIRRVLALVPCWKITGCKSNNGEDCEAYKNRKYPCWSAKEKKVREHGNCRDCEVYKQLVKCEDIRKLMQQPFITN